MAQPVPTYAQKLDGTVVASQLNAFVLDRPAFARVDVYLNEGGVNVKSEAGSMIWMDKGLDVKTYMGASCKAACCAGETCFHNDFSGNGKITFAFKLPGDILPFMVGANESWICNQGAYICSTPNVAIEARFAGCLACCCGGENPFLTKLSSNDGQPGVFYAGGYGAITRHDIEAGKYLVIDNGLFFAAKSDMAIDLALPGGCMGCVFGGEGLVMRLQGPATVFSQNRDPFPWRKLLKPQPQKQSQGGGGGADGAF
jgi:uncharacterized protein (AIM24 family)